MNSDDGAKGADDQVPYSEPPPGQRPPWRIWAIVGGTAALVAIVGVVGIFVLNNGGTPDGKSNGPANELAAAVDQLRSHLPKDLRFAKECVEDSPLSGAAATIMCTWPKSDVPRTAAYSLFADGTSMLKSALALVPGQDHGSSCRSADDFSDTGGQMLWQRDERDRGTVWCFLNKDSEPVIVWTDTTPKILAKAIAPAQEDAGQLLEWFRTVGQASLNAEPAPPPPPKPNPLPSPSTPDIVPDTAPDTAPDTTPDTPPVPDEGPSPGAHPS